jgi:hypothetical protein
MTLGALGSVKAPAAERAARPGGPRLHRLRGGGAPEPHRWDSYDHRAAGPVGHQLTARRYVCAACKGDERLLRQSTRWSRVLAPPGPGAAKACCNPLQLGRPNGADCSECGAGRL